MNYASFVDLVILKKMKKQTLLKYISGKASESESMEVMNWAKSCDENKKYLTSLINMKALLFDKEENVSEKEYNKFLQKAKIKIKFSRLNNALKYAAILLLVVSFTANLIFFVSDYDSGDASLYEDKLISFQNQLNGPDSLIQEIYVVKGAKSKVTLPDGTTVWLNSDSRIKFPLKFSKNSRNVFISGEAFFDVVPNKNWPMIISSTNNILVEVLGTKFNLRSYKNDNEFQVTLYSGVINILSSDIGDSSVNKICNVNPNESFLKEINGNDIRTYKKKISVDGMNKIIAWKDGRLFFEETPMKDVIKDLERWHGIEFSIEDSSVLNYTITAKFDNESAVQIMEMLKLCAPIDYKVKGRIFSLTHK